MTSLSEVDDAFHWQLVLIERTHSVVRQSGIDMAIKKYDDSEDGDDLDRCNRLDVAKCNLGKVNLEIMLVSSFSSCTGGGPMPLAGAPREYAVAFLQIFTKCFCNSLLFVCHFVVGFFLSLPP